MAAEARRFASSGTEIVSVTAAFGTQYVENRVEAAIAAHAVLNALAKHAAGCDAAIVSAFGDPGLAAARNSPGIPVLGIEESRHPYGLDLGRRYSIVCVTPRLRRGTSNARKTMASLDGWRACVPWTSPSPISLEPKTNCATALLEQCWSAIEHDEAEVIILGGGPIAGLAREAADKFPCRCWTVSVARCGWRRRWSGPPGRRTRQLRATTTEIVARPEPGTASGHKRRSQRCELKRQLPRRRFSTA